MAEQKKLISCLDRLTRRTSFRSENRVNASLFFHAIYSTLIELNNMKEEYIEEKLLKHGSISFHHLDDHKKVTVSITFQDLKADNPE